jgi:hypothetical protein
MNTGTRRFILRLAVGLLAFLIGVSAAWALGGFNPFQSFSGTRHYRHKRCGSYRSSTATPEPAFIYPLYRKHENASGTLRQREEQMPPPAPLADSPMPPSPPRVLR